MSSDDSVKLDMLLIIGVGVGLGCFYRGFSTYREYRVLMDTPKTPIRSVAMGLVEIHGKATGNPIVTSPVTRTPCHFYQVEIDHWVQDQDGGYWSHIATDIEGIKFHLADSTGKVLVYAHEAEFDLVKTAQIEARPSSDEGLGKRLSDLAAAGRTTAAPALSNTDLWNYASGAVARLKGAGSRPGKRAEKRYRLTERLIIPEHWYDITGTCVENPAPQDEHDRNMIVKGTNEPTFLITWRSEKEIRKTLLHRALNLIFGGATLAIVCLGLFLAKHGWLF
jgi:hypothetical protein